MIDKSHIISSYTQFANNATNIISYIRVISPFTVTAQMTRAESNIKTFAIVCFCNIKHIKNSRGALQWFHFHSINSYSAL